MQATFFKGVVLGTVISALMLAATTALAGSGIGGIFNLGVANTVNQRSDLTGSSAGGMLRVTNASTAATQPTVEGISNSTSQAAIRGLNRAGGPGVRGFSPTSAGVWGSIESATASRGGVRGTTISPDGYGGLFENLTAGVGSAGTGLVALGRSHTLADLGIGPDGFDGGIEAAGPNGIEGNSHTPGGFGVSGDGPAVGVNGTATATDGTGGNFTGGSAGNGVNASGGSVGVNTNVTGSGAVGIRSNAGPSANDAVQGTTANGVGDALQGVTSGGAAFGVFAITSGGGTGVVSSSGPGTAVGASNGSATNSTITANNSTASGTAGLFTATNGVRVRPIGTSGTGLTADMTGDTNGNGNAADDANNAIFASSDDTNNSAVIFANSLPSPTCDEFTCEAIETSGFVDINGNARVTGTLTKGAGAFEIDHPLDPANYYLRHSFVESPDMKNVYDGVITTDQSGKAKVQLPDYFGALNKDPRYQLTVISGGFAQAIVSKELAAGGRTFEIRTNKPNIKVSWQVTGIRQDAYANANRIKVVEKKTGDAAGMYLHPELFGFPGLRPLGLDVPASPDTAATQRAQNDLLALIQKKADEARKEAAAAGRQGSQAGPAVPSQQQ